MEILYENLAHFTHGMVFMFFLLASIYFFNSKNKNQLTKFLFWEMVFWTCIHLKDVGYLVPGIWDNDYLSNIFLSIDMWCIPATILLFFKIISPGWTTSRTVVVMMFPSMLFTLIYLWIPSNALFKINLIYSNALGIVALLIVFLASSRYDNFVKRNFSFVEHIGISWIRKVILLLFFLLFIWSFEISFSTWLNDAFYYFLQIIMWSIIIYFTSGHEVIEIPNYIDPFVHSEKESSFNPDEFPFKEKLCKVMDHEKLYLNPKLTIADVAVAIGTNRTYLSEYINRNLDSTFYEYINSFRVKYACALLIANGGAYSLEQIAEDCGFNSFSTFRRSFLKETGMTAAQYRKRNTGY